MRSFNLKRRVTAAPHADASKPESVQASMKTPMPSRPSTKETRGIYSATRNLDSNFRC